MTQTRAIPKRLRVGRKMYSVEIVDAMPKKGHAARVHFPQQTITLGRKSNVTGRRYAPGEMQDSFWHELVHAILYDMGKDTLNKDERFVTGFANRLTKAINSARFE